MGGAVNGAAGLEFVKHGVADFALANSIPLRSAKFGNPMPLGEMEAFTRPEGPQIVLRRFR